MSLVASALVGAVAWLIAPVTPQESSKPTPASAPVSAPVATDVDAAIARGLDFLMRAQHHGGGFGGPENATQNDFWKNPEIHRAWSVGSTGLVVMLLCEVPRNEKLDATLVRALKFLVDNAELKKPEDWDLDTIWGHIYGLQGLARALSHPDVGDATLRGAMRGAAAHHVKRLMEQRTPIGGWGYYTFGGWPRPDWTVSFTTAAALLALLDAKQAGFEVPADAIAKAADVIVRCRQPEGAYDYAWSPLPSTTSPYYFEGLNTLEGSVGRSQCCNLALSRCQKLDARALGRGLDDFFRHHRFLDIARQRPIPHEAYYQVASYFFFFGHFYAAEVLSTLPVEVAAPYARKLEAVTLKTQEPDGSMWDHYMHDHGKAYGTAYGLLVLVRCRAIQPGR